MKNIEFTVLFTNEFGLGLEKRKAKRGSDPEETFKNILKSLPKRLERNWIIIEFELDGELFEVSAFLFTENEFDFWAANIAEQKG